MTNAQLIELSRLPSFSFGKYTFVSQEPFTISERDRSVWVPALLPMFVLIWEAIERVTGHRWKCTSYIRDSPTHIKGHAFDLAPDITAEASPSYAVTNTSDPVLYKRSPLIRSLQRLIRTRFADNCNVGIFIEPDHLHIQAMALTSGNPTSIIKWKVEKSVYPDSSQRMKLPMFQ